MTATTTTLSGPVSRIDPATAYRRPESVPGLLRLDSNEGVLPSPALLGDLANADPELLRRYPDVSALEAALAARVGERGLECGDVWVAAQQLWIRVGKIAQQGGGRQNSL